MTEDEFRERVAARGFPDPQPHTFTPGCDEGLHTHDFHVMLYFLSGEFSLVREDGTDTYGPGDTCELAAGIQHTERTGPDGVTALLSRKPA